MSFFYTPEHFDEKAGTEKETTTVDLSIFASPEAWISLVTLIFLEIVLGVDNIVFISITSNRLPEEKQHIGRKLGRKLSRAHGCAPVYD